MAAYSIKGIESNCNAARPGAGEVEEPISFWVSIFSPERAEADMGGL